MSLKKEMGGGAGTTTMAPSLNRICLSKAEKCPLKPNKGKEDINVCRYLAHYLDIVKDANKNQHQPLSWRGKPVLSAFLPSCYLIPY